jgi:tripartite-type tricarboxylate transporter receptor subunit TctC
LHGSRVNLPRLLAIVVLAGFPATRPLAQSYPVKPIRMVVGFAAGGSVDVTGRIVAQKLAEQLGQQVIVENRTGAGGAIANERVAASPPDGYTLLMVSTSATIVPALNPKLPYDLERDLAPVSFLSIGPLVLVVHPSIPARSVKELIALIRSQPGKLNYGSSGIGSTAHLPGELLKLMAKVNIVHVPYKGGAESVVALAAGQLALSFPSITAAQPLIDVGKLCPLAVTSIKRSSLMPAVPTLDEAGVPGYEFSNWNGFSAPAGLPKDILMRLNAAAKAIDTPDTREAFAKQGFDLRTSTPEEFAAFIRPELVQNAKLIKLSGAIAE